MLSYEMLKNEGRALGIRLGEGGGGMWPGKEQVKTYRGPINNLINL